MAEVSLKRVFVLLVALGALPSPSLGHGRLREPPSRSSMWRDGFDNPRNYRDNGLNCGGYKHQWQNQGGRCGICGDPDDGPRVNEPGPDNLFANGIISREYEEGQVIDVKIHVTAPHKGWFEFRICPQNDVTTAATQSCLDQYLLPLASQPGVTRYSLPVGALPGWYNVTLQLPRGLLCDQCVFQWHWNTGNRWGCFAPRQCCLGCGDQEMLLSCADVRITEKRTATTTTSTATPATTTTTTAKSTKSESGVCRAVNEWKGDSNMDTWCINNCAAGYCPETHCTCG